MDNLKQKKKDYLNQFLTKTLSKVLTIKDPILISSLTEVMAETIIERFDVIEIEDFEKNHLKNLETAPF